MPQNVNASLTEKLKELEFYDSISEIYIKNDNAFCCIELPIKLLSQLEDFQKKTEEALLSIEGINNANVSFTTQRKTTPFKPSQPKKIVPKQISEPPSSPIAKNIIAIASGKGGVGKSTCAVNLAKALASLNLKTGLLDLDVYGPSVPYLMNIKEQQPQNTTVNGKRTILPIKIDNIEVMSIGFFLKPEIAVIWRGHMASSFVKQMVNEVSWGELDILIVDLPPGTGDIQITLAQQLKINGAIVISTPHELALLDVRRCLDMFKQIKIPILGLIENMSYFIAPDSNKIYYPFGKNAVKYEAEHKGIKLLAQLPLQNNINLVEYTKIAQTIIENLL